MSHLLQTLERLSQEQPAAAVRIAEKIVLEVELDLVPKVLAICGTAYRRLERHNDAMHVLLDAEQMTDDLATLADIKQRIAYVVAAKGDLETATDLILVAQNLYTLASDFSGVGRTLVDQGMFCYHRGDLGFSRACLNQALNLLDENEARHRYSALVGLGLCMAKEDLDLAQTFFDRAAVQAQKVGCSLRWKLLWARARLFESHGRRLDARQLFETLTEEYLECDHLLDACLAAVDLIRVTQELGENPQTYADLVRRLVFALPEQGIAADAVSVMFVCCVRGQVRSEILKRVEMDVKRELREGPLGALL